MNKWLIYGAFFLAGVVLADKVRAVVPFGSKIPTL